MADRDLEKDRLKVEEIRNTPFISVPLLIELYEIASHGISRAQRAEAEIEKLECRIDGMRDEIRMLNSNLNQGGRRYG